MWQPPTPIPQPNELELRHGPIRLWVGPADGTDELIYQSFSLNFGRHSSASQEQCLESWPAESIALARKALDGLEAYLESQSCDPPA
jgi:hypothetical protein